MRRLWERWKLWAKVKWKRFVTDDELVEAHSREYEKADYNDSEECGCFFCLRTFPPSQIEEWVGRKKEPVCPHCGIDSVLPDSVDERYTKRVFLEDMYHAWFGIREKKGQ